MSSKLTSYIYPYILYRKDLINRGTLNSENYPVITETYLLNASLVFNNGVA